MSIVKLNNRSVKDVTAFGSISSLGSLTHIATQTASSSASVSFTSGIDSTYKEYIFYFNNIHPSIDDKHFTFNGSDDTYSHSYDITKTSTAFMAYHNESGSDSNLAYSTSGDLAQGTGFQNLTTGDTIGSDNDQSLAGFLHLFNPSSTTFAKNFLARTTVSGASNYNSHAFFGGYFNTTSAITAIQFKMASGNISSGQILLFGLN